MSDQDQLVIGETIDAFNRPDSKIERVWILSHAGSRSYGTETQDSDYDYKGVYRTHQIEDFFRQEVQHPISIGSHDAKLTAQVSFLKQLYKGSFTAVEPLWDPNPLILDGSFRKVFYQNPRLLTKEFAKSYWGCYKSYEEVLDKASITDASGQVPTPRETKALYHSFRNLEKIRMICAGEYELHCKKADYLKGIRSGEVPFREAFSNLVSELIQTENIFKDASFPPELTYEELYEMSDFMRKY